jgi:predicted TIM-barrel fold metal-dependent hydrolase
VTKSRYEPEIESPIPFHVGSNGEYVPLERTARDRRAERLFAELSDRRARKLGVSRRDFVGSVLGTATALTVINQVYGCSSDGESTGGGGYGGTGTGLDPGECQALTGDEFIFDVQTHHVNPEGPWRESTPLMEAFLGALPQASCGEDDHVVCYSADHYIREMFLRSDTTMAVLSSLPAAPGSNPLEAAEMRASIDLINKLAGSQRAIIHGQVLPEEGQEQLDGMQRLKEDHGIAAWKVYTPYSATGVGWRLDDEDVGIPFIERARELDIKIICCHKGLPLPGFDPDFASPVDVGIVAAAYPDVRFVVYHSAYELGNTEGAYDDNAMIGIDTLIKAFEDNGIAKNTGNVYAEIGSTWRALMTEPVQAAHAIGKLLLHIGEDRVVWGTDSIWYGSPQDQIAAFRAFEISTQLQDEFGYPALTPEIKKKIFGLNSAALYGIDPEEKRCAITEDAIAKEKMALLHEPRRKLAGYRKFGPQTRREFFDYLRYHGGKPG